MSNAKRPSAPSPKDENRQPNGNKAPFSPQNLMEVAPGGSVSKKGGPNTYFTSDECEKGTGDSKPVWP